MEYNITIRGQIGGWFGVSAAAVVGYCEKHKGEHLDVAICSPGGYVDEGIEIYQAFRDHGDIHAHIIGMTASAATIIAMGAKTIDMAKNSLMLIHNASTFVNEFGSMNKEQLDKLLESFRQQMGDLATIDDLIANIYADRSGRPLDDIKKKMTEGRWLSPTEAKELGLIDSIREDEQANKVLSDIRHQYSASIIEAYALPSLPAEATASQSQDSTLGPVADAEGNPTESFLQKTLAALRKLFTNSSSQLPITSKPQNLMKKTFALVCSILAIEALEVTDGKASIQEADLQKVEDRLQELQDLQAAAEERAADLQKQLDQASKTIEDKDAQIEALKAAPGAPVDGTPEPAPQTIDHDAAIKLFNAINPN